MTIKDELEELQAWKVQKEKEEAVLKATRGMVMLRCSTVFISIWTALGLLGTWAAEHFKGIDAAVRAFISTEYR